MVNNGRVDLCGFVYGFRKSNLLVNLLAGIGISLLTGLFFCFLFRYGSSDLVVPRVWHASCLLKDGRVLLVGGVSFQGDNGPRKWADNLAGLGLPIRLFGNHYRPGLQRQNICEIFDPVLNRSTQTGPWDSERPPSDVYCFLLPSGKVFAIDTFVCKIFDPLSGTWTDLDGPSQDSLVNGYRLRAVLPGFRLLVAGGAIQDKTGFHENRSFRIYEPLNDSARPESIAPSDFGNGTSSLLSNGDVLLVGGESDKECFIFDSTNLKWNRVSDLLLGRSYTTQTTLLDGRVMVVGGFSNSLNKITNSCEIFDSKLNTWCMTGNLNVPRLFARSILLKNGDVLALGGRGRDHRPLGSCELYDCQTSKWSLVSKMKVTLLAGFSADLLRNGKVLLVGEDSRTKGAVWELYNPFSDSWTISK